MHITQHTDFSLRVLIFLAVSDDRLVTIEQIATQFGISRSHLMKVVNELIHAGFVTGVRGAGGGLRLATSSANLSVGAVVRVMEPSLQLLGCFGEASDCVLMPRCRLKRVFGRALEAFLKELDDVKIAELIGSQEMQLRGGQLPPPSNGPLKK